ncbi:hypothetical protein [Halobacteriovorax sp. HLS]|uniref:hypothetical protein n=1 Tax=Halobacteriovorax sp. HLS TaxID=2234000 RepID=UPI000FD9FA36|nr:hypothetical protein [Halobacteriovorax sp. HLS]
MTTKSTNKLSFLLYDKKKGPIFLTTNKALLKFTFYVLPIITMICLVVVIAGSVYFKQIAEMARRKEPEIIKELKGKNLALSAQLEEIAELNKLFEKKLSSTDTSGIKLSTLSLFRAVPSQEDLSSQPLLSLDNTKFDISENKLNLKFDIVNQTTDGRKLSGYIHIQLATTNRMIFYPENEIASEDMLLSYNQGESFAFSRLRHVSANFDLTGFKDSKALIKIIVFSRTGDVLFKKLIAQNIK